VCIDKANDGTRITELLKAKFPHVPMIARGRVRVHSLELICGGADAQVRETFEAAATWDRSHFESLAVERAEIEEAARSALSGVCRSTSPAASQA
jgi:glutathione-regulated potassium-efflux system protein KefB